MVKLASRKNASPWCLISCFAPIGSEVEGRNNGRVVTLECSAGKRCVLASAWFVWRSNPSGPKTFVGCDEMEELTQEQIIASKKERNQLLVSQQESVRGPSSGSWHFRSVNGPHWRLYNIGTISLIGTIVGLDICLSLRTLTAFHPIRRSQANWRQRCSRSTLVSKAAEANVDTSGGCCRNNSIHATIPSTAQCLFGNNHWWSL